MPVPLVGRQIELRDLSALLDEGRRGAGRVVFLEGEAGIGKTRLLAEVKAVAPLAGFQVVSGAADEVQSDRPFGAFAEALALDPRSLDVERAQLGRLIVGEVTEGQDSRASDLGFRIVESIVGLVEQAATAGPLLIALEDIHWSDPSTLRALRSLGRAVAQLPVVVVATLRPFPRSRELDGAVDDLVSRGACRLTLEPLGEQEVAALADALAGDRLDARASHQLAAAGGNPLLLIELLTAPPADGPVGAEDDQWPGAPLPPTLELTVRRRVRSLPAPTVEAIKVAAVLGRRFSLMQLSAVMGDSPVALVSKLDAALAARLLGEEEGELVFRHELIRLVVYADLALPLRRGLHREAARVLREIGAPVGQVAEHLLAGAGPGDLDAVEGLARAGHVAAPRAPRSAVRLLEAAIGLLEPGDPQLDGLAGELAPLLIQAGRASDAARLSREILARRPDPEVAIALRRALGEVLWTQGWLEAAVGELEAAARITDASEVERCRA